MIEFIRSSSIYSYIECPARFYFQNIEKVKTPNKLALAFGTSIHKTLEMNFRQKIDTREDLGLNDVKDYYSSVADQEFSAVDKTEFAEEKPGEVKDSGIELIEMYHKNVSPRIQPAQVELEVKVRFKGMPIGLSGTIDLIDEDNVLVDHKTSSRDMQSVTEGYQVQVGGAYPILARAYTGNPVSAVRIDGLIRRNRKQPEGLIRHLQVIPDEGHFFRIFEQVTAGIQQGVFFPNRGCMFCSRKYCKFWNECEVKFGGRVKQ